MNNRFKKSLELQRLIRLELKKVPNKNKKLLGEYMLKLIYAAQKDDFGGSHA